MKQAKDGAGEGRQKFDPAVHRALAKWPNVPACYGWLGLDRRGRWLIKGAVISHPGAVDFLGRNYACDADGGWFVQNGPQRAYVDLAYTPWVYRLDGDGGIHTHTALKVEKLNKLLIDQEGCLLIDSDIGIGVLEDRDLQRLLDAVTVDDHGCTDIDSAVTLLYEDAAIVFEARYCGAPCSLAAIDSDRVASAYGFKQTPSPPDRPNE